MTFQIRTNDGRILTVHTEVGEGTTRVVIEEEPREPVAIESCGDQE